MGESLEVLDDRKKEEERSSIIEGMNLLLIGI